MHELYRPGTRYLYLPSELIFFGVSLAYSTWYDRIDDFVCCLPTHARPAHCLLMATNNTNTHVPVCVSRSSQRLAASISGRRVSRRALGVYRVRVTVFRRACVPEKCSHDTMEGGGGVLEYYVKKKPSTAAQTTRQVAPTSPNEFVV